MGGASALALQQLSSLFQSHPPPPPPPPPQPQAIRTLKKPSKGVKAYPHGWQQVLNGAKDVVRGTVLVKELFPNTNPARVTVGEAFHEVLASECNINGLVLEPGGSPLILTKV